jgi:15-cis-phytoene synthase
MRFVDAFRTEEMSARAAEDTVALAADYARCARITRQASSNFYYAFMLLPLERRRALYAVYAFCRFVDDIADDDSITDPAAMLARWRDELDNVFAGTPTRPVSRALAENTARFNIPRRYFEEVIDGVEMDLSQRRYETFDELSLYCRRVASAVGLICIEIFGYSNPASRLYAEKLGLAFQLTNIIRDVREDAGRGRIYLPLEDLRRFGVTESELLDGVYNDRFRALMAFEASRARGFYREAADALPSEDRPSMLSAEAMRLIYSALLEQIVRSEYRVLDRRHRLSTPRKLYLVGRAWAGSRLARASG